MRLCALGRRPLRAAHSPIADIAAVEVRAAMVRAAVRKQLDLRRRVYLDVDDIGAAFSAHKVHVAQPSGNITERPPDG